MGGCEGFTRVGGEAKNGSVDRRAQVEFVIRAQEPAQQDRPGSKRSQAAIARRRDVARRNHVASWAAYDPATDADFFQRVGRAVFDVDDQHARGGRRIERAAERKADPEEGCRTSRVMRCSRAAPRWREAACKAARMGQGQPGSIADL